MSADLGGLWTTCTPCSKPCITTMAQARPANPDDRDAPEVGVLELLGSEFPTVHDRHGEIKQDPFAMPLDVRL